MAKRNPFLVTKTVNGKAKTFDNTNHGVLYPNFDIREGAMLGTFNHGPTGKELTALAVPAQGGYALVLHEGKEVYARGKLTSGRGRIAFEGTVGEGVKIVAFSATDTRGDEYLQIRPDKRDAAKHQEQVEQARSLADQLTLWANQA